MALNLSFLSIRILMYLNTVYDMIKLINLLELFSIYIFQCRNRKRRPENEIARVPGVQSIC